VLPLSVFCFLSIGYSVPVRGERRNVRDLLGERALERFTSLYMLKFI
jgi:hypothetical protein